MLVYHNSNYYYIYHVFHDNYSILVKAKIIPRKEQIYGKLCFPGNVRYLNKSDTMKMKGLYSNEFMYLCTS